MGQPKPVISGFAAEAAEVARLLAKGQSKSALDSAKQIHKRHGTAESESLLVDAYAARARSLVEQQLIEEAEALLAMARAKYPKAASRLASSETAMPLVGTRLSELVRPLADPDLAPEKRGAIEAALRAGLTDPAELSRVTSLPSEHPLRLGAAALTRAFQAATSGPVSEEALALRGNLAAQPAGSLEAAGTGHRLLLPARRRRVPAEPGSDRRELGSGAPGAGNASHAGGARRRPARPSGGRPPG